jgi:hypothetical protein
MPKTVIVAKPVKDIIPFIFDLMTLPHSERAAQIRGVVDLERLAIDEANFVQTVPADPKANGPCGYP